MGERDPRPMNRRTFIRVAGGWAAVAVGGPEALAQAAGGIGRALDASASRFDQSAPIHALGSLGRTTMVDGVPFWADFSGDRFEMAGQHPPFPSLGEWIGYGVEPPRPTTDEGVVIVGGGLAGLCAAYLLRDLNPLVLEHNNRFGGNAQAERWQGLSHSIGGAYVIEPDEPLATLYTELGVDREVRITPGPPGPDPVEHMGVLIKDFWYGAGQPPEVAQRFLDYLALVGEFGENYPDIPLPDKGAEWIIDLDRRSFKQDVEARIGPLPHLLEAAIQHYFWSSFGAGWEEVSAAGGWNFVAAEQFGQWVFPGGTALIAQRLWERVRAAIGPERLRPRTVVLDARPAAGGGVALTYGLPDGSVRALRAQRVVMACPKFVCKGIMPEYLLHDPARLNSMQLMETRAYAVVNVLLNVGLDDTFYDAFFLEDGSLPGSSEAEQRAWTRPLDAVSAGWTIGGTTDRATLTLYWPLSFATGRGLLLGQQAFAEISGRLLPHLDHILATLGLSRSAIEQVRMTRWGHALPISAPNLIADGHCQRVREPIGDEVYFINQDNWALPAVETSLLEAFHYAPQVRRGL